MRQTTSSQKRPQFLDVPVVQKAFEIAQLAGGEGRLVGGVVRDWLLERPLGDYDMAVTVPIGDFITTARAQVPHHDVKIIETGLAHGSVTMLCAGQMIEVTQTRSDISTDGRHAEIGFTPSFIEDAKRRDFTINALYLDKEGLIHDPLSGHSDLTAGVIRFIGDAKERVSEDYLRILRFFRFAAKLDDFVLDEKQLAEIAGCFSGLSKVSGERILSEMQKTFAGIKASYAVQKMAEIGLDKVLFGAPFHPKHLLFDQLAGWQAVAASYLSDEARKAFMSLPHARADRARIHNYLVPFSKADFAKLHSEKWQEIAYFGGADFAMRAKIQQRHHSIVISAQRWKEIENFVPPPCPVTGHHLEQAGVATGPQIGKLLEHAALLYVQSNYQLDAQDIIAQVMRR